MDKETLLNTKLVETYIYDNMELNYYWSDSFEDEFYIELAKAGFISTSMYDMNNNCILLPEIQFDYAVLHFDNLHISKKVSHLIKKNDYVFTVNQKLNDVLEAINDYHEISWISPEYKKMLLSLSCRQHANFELLSVELNDKNNNLIAGEVGYKIGRTYTSLTGFFKREKKYNNWGKLQLVLLSNYLEEHKYDFWNLGHSSLLYKIELGAKVFCRKDFIKIWKKSINI